MIYNPSMKKLLLLLVFISFTFIGSANASSIKGAFGYILGEVEEIEGHHATFNNITNISKKFRPSRPLPGFEKYYIHVTLNENKIYSIRALTYTDKKIYERSCYDSKKIKSALTLLKSKYGTFKLSENERVKVTYVDFDYYVGEREVTSIEEYRRWQFHDGNRSIILSCSKRMQYGDDFSFELEYIDNDLSKLFDEENIIKNGKPESINLNSAPDPEI